MNPENILIHPRKGKKEKSLPSVGLLFANPVDAYYAHELLAVAGGRKRFLYNSGLTVAGDGSLFVAGPAVGSPMAAMTLEKLIALGTEKLILFGWCGAISSTLKIGDIILGGVPNSGEGTSRYYPLSEQPGPSSILNQHLSAALREKCGEVSACGIWSTDAPYREERGQIADLLEQRGVMAVDMEYSALCTVSCFRGIEFAALFLVSDELYGSHWKPGFATSGFREKRKMLVELLLDISL